MPGEDQQELAPPSSPAGTIPPAPQAGGDRHRHAAGQRVAGKYRLIRVLGRGGMGDVWLARNETLDIDVAVKLLRKEADGPEAGSRFLREARAAARLTHPAIVRIFDFGIAEGGEPFIVMEHLTGEDLAMALQRCGRYAAIHAVRTILPIAHALVAAHAKGVVHRDLKPENVFLARAGGDGIEPKVVDFGVAKLDLPKELALTKNGMLLGSPAYMSPEQAQGTGVDHRADVWSLAVVLYEMVAGVRPFDAKTHNATLIAIGRQEPRPFTELSAGDEELWAIVAKGLSKDRRQRWDSMRAFGEALAAWALARGATEDVTGRAIEATWRESGEGFVALGGSLPPPAQRRETVDTVRRDPGLDRRFLWGAGAGAAAALLVGAVIWGRPSHGGDAAAAPSARNVVAPASSATGVSSAPPVATQAPASAAPAPSVARKKAQKPVPVKTLSDIPIDGQRTRSGAATIRRARRSSH